MKTRVRPISKSELPAVRHKMGLTIKRMARAVGLKLPSYYYYETRYVGDELPTWLSHKVTELARKRNIDLSRSTLRAVANGNGRASARDEARLLRDILKTLHDIRVIMRDRGPSAVFVVNDERSARIARHSASIAARVRQ
jgi:hypothetical protein